MDKNPLSFLGLLTAYLFIGAYLFNFGYFYKILAYDNVFLSFSDVINTSVALAALPAYLTVGFAVLIIQFSKFADNRAKLLGPAFGPAIALTFFGFFAFLGDKIFIGSTYSVWSLWTLTGGMMSIISAMLNAYLDTIPKINYPANYLATFAVAMMLTLPLNILIGYYSFKAAMNIEYELKIANSSHSLRLKAVRNLESGYLGINKNGKVEIISKNIVSEVVIRRLKSIEESH